MTGLERSAQPAGRSRAGSERRTKTRAKVLDAAERLMAVDLDWDRLRVEDIAAEANVSPASIYTHFGTKAGVVAAAVQRVLVGAAEAMRGAYGSDGSEMDRIEASGVAYMRLLLDHPVIARYMIAGGPPPPSDSATHDNIRALTDELRTELENLIQRAMESGEIEPVDSRLMSYFLFGSWNGVAAMSQPAGSTDAEKAIQQAIRVIRRGLDSRRSR